MQDNLALLGTRTLRQLCMPGSHDAGMSTVSHSFSLASACNTVTQSQPIGIQLQAGVRYFDIRPVFYDAQWYTGHFSPGPIGFAGATGITITDVVDAVNDFTANHHELVILVLSHGLDLDVDRPLSVAQWTILLNKLRSSLQNRHVAADAGRVDLTRLTLNDYIQGRSAVIVLVQSAEGETAIKGTFFFNHGFYTTDNFTVVDLYSATNDVTVMIHDQIEKMHEHRTNPSRPVFLLSWTLTQSDLQAKTCVAGLAPSVLSLAHQANGFIGQIEPSSTSQIYPNVLYLDDVVTAPLVDLAMAINGFAQPLQPVELVGQSSSQAPAAAEFGGFVHAIYKGSVGAALWSTHSNDGGHQWSAPMQLAGSSSHTPGLTVFNQRLHLLWKGVATDARMYSMYTIDGASWTAPVQLGAAVNTSDGPSTVVFDGQLYAFYKAMTGDTAILHIRLINENVWSAPTLVPIPLAATDAAPAAIVFNNRLCLAWKGAFDDRIYVSSSADLHSWTAPITLRTFTTDAPSMAIGVAGDLLLFHRGSVGDRWLYCESSFNLTDWSNRRLEVLSKNSPRAVTIGSVTNIFFRGAYEFSKLFRAAI